MSVNAIDSSVELVRGEVSKLNKFLKREVCDSIYSRSGILSEPGSASACPPVGEPADDPNGHRMDSSRRETGFGRVFTQTHLPHNGTTDTPFPKEPRTFDSTIDHDSGTGFRCNKFNYMGNLPKVHFPLFNADNPKL